ncbi:hypothetical protein M752DRAFT_63756 [Aspergillus phoenicis ATCC 13157]|uniref:Uncharacterized protein n=1 Tax=Aspergillus phoenicis ATCC 13157 TaxID=1353007 RepID=A0A370PX72_ASPPH|nr:hypothetical protein M752DRAFT_63756 [Aspergillus phoenicis ATCC 13157]
MILMGPGSAVALLRRPLLSFLPSPLLLLFFSSPSLSDLLLPCCRPSRLAHLPRTQPRLPGILYPHLDLDSTFD